MKGFDFYARVSHAVTVEEMSRREASWLFWINRRTVEKMLRFPVPPVYWRECPVKRPELDAFVWIIDGILDADRLAPAK